MLLTITKAYHVHNTVYTIVKQDEMYLAINRKYITDGKLNKPLNGLQMHASEDLNVCLELARNQAEIDYYISVGFSKEEAIMKVLKININF